ncbi:hypothetical protein F4780DRAFT_345018 [Xylariomycetidae sp. FL0641]|nr:hypothetical protein F4780DRAFT_345018 [Xylariomycetidae sp. FL0641]
MTQAVTIVALGLRLIISYQSTVCTSMVAALVLERCSVRKSNAAFVSVMQGLNDGPRKLLETMLTLLNFSILTYIEFWLLLLMAIVTLGLQFTSTILLSDLHNFVIVSDPQHAQVPKSPVWFTSRRETFHWIFQQHGISIRLQST